MPRHRIALSLALIICTVLPSTGMAVKFLGITGAALYAAAVAVAVAFAVAAEANDRVSDVARRYEILLAGAWILAMIAALAVLYPVAQSGSLGRGSDRDDALRVGAQALLELRYPYYERTYFGGQLSPAPGALLIAVPFHLLADVVVLPAAFNVLGGLCLAGLMRGWRTRWLLIPVLTFGNLALMQDHITGGDFAPNAVYVGIAVYLTLRAFDRAAPRRGEWALCAVLLGVAMCSRPVYPLAGIVLSAHAWRRHGARRALLFAALAFGTTAAIGLPFYLYEPNNFGPLHLGRLVPRDVRYLTFVLPLAAAAVALLPMLRDVGRRGVFATMAAATLAMLLPALLARLSVGKYDPQYLIVAGLYGTVALLMTSHQRRTPAAGFPTAGAG